MYLSSKTICFPFQPLEIKCLPIRLNHEYSSSLFDNDFVNLIPECFGVLAVFIVLLYGVICTSSFVPSQDVQGAVSPNKQFDITLLTQYNPSFENSVPEKSKTSVTLQTNGTLASHFALSYFPMRLIEPGFDTTKRGIEKPEKRAARILGVNSSLLAILSIVFTILLFCNHSIYNASVLACCFRVDDFGLFLQILTLAASGFAIVISLQYLEQEKLNNFELQTVILISSIMMLFLICSVDFISIYLAIECQSLCFYVMAGMKRENEFSTEAGLKYFLLGAFSSGILLFGFALQYGFTGTTNFSELSKIFLSTASSLDHNIVQWPNGWQDGTQTFHFVGDDTLANQRSFASSSDQGLRPASLEEMKTEQRNSFATALSSISALELTEMTPSATKRGSEAGMVFILVGFLFKLSAVPFHMWAPDVYEGSPTSVTAFFAIVPKISIVAICLRLCYVASYRFIVSWQSLLILSSILSMLVGSFAALTQNKIKRLLAWSSISHVGFLLSAHTCGTIEGSQAVVFYLVVYIVMTIALFIIILLPLRREKINSWKTALNFLSTKASGPTSESKDSDSMHFSSIAQREAERQQKDKSSHQPESDESDHQEIKYTTDLAFLSQTYPIVAVTIMITMFSIAGIPPLAGFWSKAFLLFATMSAKQTFLSMIIILTSVISCFYYIRIVKVIYFETKQSLWKSALKERFKTSVLTFMSIGKESCLVWGITVAILVLFFLLATQLEKTTHLTSLSLC